MSRGQQTISHLFSAAQQKKPLTPDDHSPPSNKRKRSVASCQSSTTLPYSNMYSFSSKAGSSSYNGVVDPLSPQNKHRRLSVGAKVDHAPTHGQGGLKKLVVRNFKVQPKGIDTAFVEKNIALLEAALTAILSNQQPSRPSEELYRACENVCKMGHAEAVAKMVMAKCESHVAGELKEFMAGFEDQQDPISVLRATLATWEVWMAQTKEVRGIFFYLDRSYLLQLRLPTIYDTAVALFRTHIYTPAKDRISDGACGLLLAEREDRSMDGSMDAFASAVKMFYELQIYTTDFEPHMLALSQSYIVKWAEKECSEELPIYVTSCVELIDREMRRCEMLDKTTRRSLLMLLEEQLIDMKLAELTDEKSIADILNKDIRTSANEMKAVFDLLDRRRFAIRLKDPFSKWLTSTGTAITYNKAEQEHMVVRLLEFKQKLDHIWRKSFAKHEHLGHALRDGFASFMNQRAPRSSTEAPRIGEMIAKYVDGLMRAGAKAIQPQVRTVGGVKHGRAFTRAAQADEMDIVVDLDTDEDREVENQLDQVLDLFRFLEGKAEFEAFYKKDLARRLLLGRSASNDAERNMLERLKTECGGGFTHNLEQMFKDIDLADEESKQYKLRTEHSKSSVIDLSVRVLSSAAWPTYPDMPIAIPAQVKSSLEDYLGFYHLKHSGRKLEWKHGLAHCIMKANFPKGKKDLEVSACQAVILLLFNGRGDEQLSYGYIKSESGLTDVEAQRTLQSLACAKLRPLTKHPKSRDVSTTDSFSLNASFSHEKYRVKINSIQLKETKEENQETHTRIAADRQFETQAAIVRILKEKKTISHQALIAEVIKKTRKRGVLQPPEIKKEIDKLIEKEYLERVEGNMYEYLA